MTDDTGRKTEVTRRHLLQTAMWTSAAVATGAGSWVIPARWASAADPIKVGIAT
ncbi:MAG TPA: twin-arginine translocation signal domain-containing protein, partial [Alphaproteobacteria bacterium]|nr:twin-arginine translocation signal domain-containing protein [Alphaproteobacteria bacterium]